MLFFIFCIYLYKGDEIIKNLKLKLNHRASLWGYKSTALMLDLLVNYPHSKLSLFSPNYRQREGHLSIVFIALPRLDYRQTWDKDFRDYLNKLDKTKPVVLCGDLNVAHKEIGG